MQKLFIILSCLLMQVAQGQTPYTGGNGSGYTAVPAPAMGCSFYVGGNGSGAVVSNSPALVCAPFFGGIADGAVSAVSPVTICPPFFGGSGDGHSVDSDNFCTILLPIRNIVFTAQKETSRHLLYWTLSDGYHPATIEIERSANGTAYSRIGSVAGNTDPAYHYQFIDTDPLAAANYYRLRITELSGAVTYSKVLVLRRYSAGHIAVYPNPAHNSATLEYTSPVNTISRMQLIHYDGRIVRTLSVPLIKGANYITLDLQGLAAGLYIVSINEERVKVVVE